jgi:hypothetical protein
MAAGARFCRRCGEPAAAAPASSVLEAETRIFGKQAGPTAHTQHINTPLTGPAYMSPTDMPVTPAAATTKSLRPFVSTTKILLAGLLLILLLIIPVSLLVIKLLSSRTGRPETPVVTVPEVPPPPPAPPAGKGGSTPISGSLVYPNAETLLDITEKNGRVLQLRTSDPIGKVVDWYTDQLKPDKVVKVPGGSTTVLRGNDIKVVITSAGPETSITVKQDGDEE